MRTYIPEGLPASRCAKSAMLFDILYPRSFGCGDMPVARPNIPFYLRCDKEVK